MVWAKNVLLPRIFHKGLSTYYVSRWRVVSSGDNLLKNRPRASTSEYKQLPINLRLFQNTVKLLDNLFLSEKAKIRNWRKKFTKIIVLFWIQSILLSFFLIFIHKHFDHSSRLSFKNICIVTLSPERLSLLLLSSHPIQEKTRSAWTWFQMYPGTF